MRVLLIVPAYNEGKNLASVTECIKGAGYDYVVIDDGSNDDTEAVCERLGINHLCLSQNLGIGGAVQAGHLYARKYDYDVDVQFDGDGQHDVSCVAALLEAIEQGSDLAIGSRFIEQTDGFQSTPLRRAGIRWLAFCIRISSGLTITDATSGFRACSRKAIDLFCGDYPADYPEPESIITAHNAGLGVKEVPVVMHERQGGKSSIGGLRSVYYMVKVSLAIFISRFARKKYQRDGGPDVVDA